MEVLIPSPLTSPYISSPRIPTHFGGGKDHHHLYYSSAPSSPSRVADFYRSFNNFSFNNRNHYQAQDQDGNTHHRDDDDKEEKEEEDDDDFAFNFSGQASKTSLSADELFDGEKIRPIQLDNNNRGAEEEARIRRPRSPNESPRGRRKDLNPFVNSNDLERGRERVVSIFTSAARSSRRVTRSLSPYRTTNLAWEEDQRQQQQQQQSTKPTSSNSKSSSKTPQTRVRRLGKNTTDYLSCSFTCGELHRHVRLPWVFLNLILLSLVDSIFNFLIKWQIVQSFVIPFFSA